MAEVKKQARLPFWMWSGVALAVLLAGWGVFASARNTRTDDALLLAPRAGDVYSVHNDSTHTYSLLLVRRAEGNMVELVPNQYETDNATPYTQLRDQPWASDSSAFTLTRLDLQIMRRKGEITDVDRP